MRRTKRASLARTVAALFGALAILILVTAPSFAHRGGSDASRIYEPAWNGSTSSTLAGKLTDDEVEVDENDDQGENEDVDENDDDQGENEDVDENDDDQGADEDQGDQGADEDPGDQGSDEDGGDDGGDD